MNRNGRSARFAIPRWRWIIGLITRRIWFRAALFSALSVALALIAAWLAPVIPLDLGTKLGAKAVDNILEILASSMLAVTTFSLTAMVSAFAAATQTLTPRVTRLLIEDATAQNALSTFLGTFLFAIVGIIALSTGFYGEKGRTVLYLGTILVVAWIAVTLLRWIQHLSGFGRVEDGIRRVEQAATRAIKTLATRPGPGSGIPAGQCARGTAVAGQAIGHVTHVDIAALEAIADDCERDIHLAALPGAFVHPERPLARVEGEVDETLAGRIIGTFTIDKSRDFPQDPRFGLVVLSEIASRALSPAVNDPGTAIAVLDAGVRIFAAMADREGDEAPCEEEDRRRLHVPELVIEDMLEDLFRPVARDGAGMIEVALRIQHTLAALAALMPQAREPIAARARDALDRALEALTSAADRADVARLHAQEFPGAVLNRS